MFLPSLRQGRPDWQELLGSAAQLFTRGVAIDWRECDRGFNWTTVALPTYPFERERYWVEGAEAGAGTGPWPVGPRLRRRRSASTAWPPAAVGIA